MSLISQITERGWLVILAAAMFTYIISLVAFVPGLDDSQLFTALASGVGGAVFRDVIGMWTSSTKAGSDLANKAMDKLQRVDRPQSQTQDVNVVNTPDNPANVQEQGPEKK